MARPDLRAVVAAGGRSSRFLAGHKALAPPWGGGLLRRVMGSLSALGLGRPVVMAGHRHLEVAAEAAALGADVVVNPDPDRGMFSSAALGLGAAREAEGVLFCPVDAAFVAPSAVLSLIAFWLGSGAEAPELAFLPEHLGRLGHPPLLGRRVVEMVLGWEGPGGLRGALASLAGPGPEGAEAAAGLRPAAGPGEGSRLRYPRLPDPGVLCDVDTVEDLAAALAAPPFRPPSPTVWEALALLRLAGPPRKMVHALTVASLALRMALAWGAAAGAGAGWRPVAGPGGAAAWQELVFAGGLLHDVDHLSGKHDLAGARRLLRLGFADLAAVVGAHTELPEPWVRRLGHAGPTSGRHLSDAAVYEGVPDGVMEAAWLVHLADKYAKGGRPVTLAERFGAFIGHGGTPEALESVARRRDMALALEAEVGRRLGRPPREAALAPIGHPLESLAERLLGGPICGPEA